jgi:CHAT domain-containing protein
MRRRAPFVVFFAIAACTPPATVPSGPAAPPLEAELAALPPGTAPELSIPRARLLRALGRQADAVTELEAAIDAARDRLDWRALSELWRELGDTQIEMAHPQEALDTYAKRLVNAKSLDVTRDRALAEVDMAYAFAYLSQWTQAEHALDDAEVLAREDLERDPRSLEKMAYVREKLLAPDVAIGLFAKARAEYAQIGDTTGEARVAVAKAYLEALDRESSAPLDRSLDDLVARVRDPEPRARLLRYRGEAAFLFDHAYDRCLKLAEEGRPLADRRGIEGLAKTMNILISVCAGKLGQVEQAVSAGERAVAYSDEEWQSTSVPSARQAASFEALLLYRHILALDIKLPERARAAAAFDAMERARGRAYLDAAVRAGAGLLSTDAEVPPLLALDKHQIEAHVAELNKEIIAGHDDPAQLARRRDALWALEDVKAAIEDRNPLITRIRVPRPATLETARAQLDDQTVLLAFLMTNEQVVAIAVTKRDARVFTIDGGPTALGAQIAKLRDEALLDPTVPLEDVRHQAAALYQKLLAPVEELVTAHPRIVVLPHGALATLPFEALVDGSGRFLVESHEVSYGQSATVALEDTSEHAAARRPFVGMGDPVYDWPAFASSRAEGVPVSGRGIARYQQAHVRGGLARLPGTAKEVTAIAALFGRQAKLYLRDQASEENVKAGALSGSRIVHIASHGLFDTDYQALALTMRPEGKEDGFLLQSEVAELTLDADLVVLSACETGRAHDVLAEPVSGMALALRTAGARKLVASLWSVDDASTAELMKGFYAPLVTGNTDYTAALTEAKRKLLASKQWRHPFYWAPFVLMRS